ncbi:flagellar basal-body MS-ring/collar protein FliF [Marinicellulosiphila megalodicopiae]|uniref:flagellar basal-body MS-ring/collar protein FliF n=1 Tax=Marinicellulosiphila megalodicopiae TaxID=2724896 RepID=UPI003BB20A84
MDQAQASPGDMEGSNPPMLDTVNAESAAVSTKKIHPIVAGFSKLTMLRQLGLLIGLSAAIALGIGMVLFTQSETYKPLLNSANSYNTKEVIQLLQQQDIDFNMNPVSGVILVTQSDLHKARLAIAGADLATDDLLGYELLDQDQPLGTSQFMENTRYMRSVEGELARTIASYNSVRSARVHLALPKRSVFVRDKRKPTASVMVELFAGGQLEFDQVKAIKNMVSASISELNPEDVVVTDQKGHLYENNEEQTQEELTKKQYDFTRKIENDRISSINSILSPILGANNFEVSVNAQVDFTKVEQTDELYNPDLLTIRSQQTLSETKTGEQNGGVPGALTNQPPLDAQAPEEAGAGDAANAPPTSTKDQATTNYVNDRTLRYSEHATGQVKRLTVAVAINNLTTVDAEGNSVTEPWPQESLDKLKIIVQNTVGFDISRGDSVDVINSEFRAPIVAQELLNFWEQPWFWDNAKQILGGLFVLIMIFGVLRPAVKNLMEKGEDEESDEDDALELLNIDEESITDDKVTLSGADEFLLPGPSETFERKLDALRGLIAEDPGRVALVLRKWIMADKQ